MIVSLARFFKKRNFHGLWAVSWPTKVFEFGWIRSRCSGPWPYLKGPPPPSLYHIAGNAGRLNNFSQCEIVMSVLHGNPVLELPCPHFRSCNHMLGALGSALGKLTGCNCGTGTL